MYNGNLIAGGQFPNVTGTSAHFVAQWNGASWSPLGSGAGSHDNDYVYTLAVYDAGGGSALFAGGQSVAFFKWAPGL